MTGRLWGVRIQGTSLHEVFGEECPVLAEGDHVYICSGVDFNG